MSKEFEAVRYTVLDNGDYDYSIYPLPRKRYKIPKAPQRSNCFAVLPPLVELPDSILPSPKIGRGLPGLFRVLTGENGIIVEENKSCIEVTKIIEDIDEVGVEKAFLIADHGVALFTDQRLRDRNASVEHIKDERFMAIFSSPNFNLARIAPVLIRRSGFTEVGISELLPPMLTVVRGEGNSGQMDLRVTNKLYIVK